jgi:DNA-binding transcriptional MerR regulator
MRGDHGMNEYGSYSKEVAELLDLNPNTLRRWSIELEKEGYVFERNGKDQRIYYKRDILSLRHLQKLSSERMPIVNACKKVAGEYIKARELEQTLGVQEKEGQNEVESSVQVTLSKEELQSLIEDSVERAVEKEREAMFKAFERKMNDVIENRDRHLVHQLNQSMEQKQLEIAIAKEEQKKKGFWAKFLNK